MKKNLFKNDVENLLTPLHLIMMLIASNELQLHVVEISNAARSTKHLLRFENHLRFHLQSDFLLSLILQLKILKQTLLREVTSSSATIFPSFFCDCYCNVGFKSKIPSLFIWVLHFQHMDKASSFRKPYGTLENTSRISSYSMLTSKAALSSSLSR